MLDAGQEEQIRKMTDAELEAQLSIADQLLDECFGRDYEARADALQEQAMLRREWWRRRSASKRSHS